MTTYQCDQCKKQYYSPLQITVKGYHPKMAGGILLPETLQRVELCSHDCMVRWMMWSLTQEPYENAANRPQ